MKIETKVTGSSKSLTAWFEEAMDNILDNVEEIVSRGVEEGEAITKLHISTRGTAKSGKKGRIETQKMYDAVKSEMTVSDKREAEGKFGWIDEYDDYFGYQEGGFDHVGGVTVEGMYALTDASEEVWENVKDRIKAVK